MSSEQPPKQLLSLGWRKFKITACKDEVSKRGNNMFVMTFLDDETKYEDMVYAISTQGKRWLLKKILGSCGVAASQDGVYEWSISDVIGKEVLGFIIHEPNEYVDRDGVKVVTTQHRISDVRSIDDEKSPWDGEDATD